MTEGNCWVSAETWCVWSELDVFTLVCSSRTQTRSTVWAFLSHYMKLLDSVPFTAHCAFLRGSIQDSAASEGLTEHKDHGVPFHHFLEMTTQTKWRVWGIHNNNGNTTAAFPRRSHHVFMMFSSCFYDVLIMFSTCFHDVLTMFWTRLWHISVPAAAQDFWKQESRAHVLCVTFSTSLCLWLNFLYDKTEPQLVSCCMSFVTDFCFSLNPVFIL